jgi:hypothetical protein
MRVARAILFLSTILFFSLPTFGQTSLQANVFRRANGRPGVMLKDTYTADARAYIVECDYPGPSGEMLHWTIAHDGIGGPPFTVRAGKSEEIACPLDTVSAEVNAVAYDDGKTEGDPQFLEKIAAERRLEAQDVTEDIQILDNALPSLDSSDPLEALHDLQMQFLQRVQQHANTGLDPTARDWVCTDVARMLASPARKQSVKILVQGYISELQKFAAVLPKPAQTSTPSSTN